LSGRVNYRESRAGIEETRKKKNPQKDDPTDLLFGQTRQCVDWGRRKTERFTLGKAHPEINERGGEKRRQSHFDLLGQVGGGDATDLTRIRQGRKLKLLKKTKSPTC